ncbi:MAG: hypothetical protein K2W82_17220 [Candidatus Obscuribacterales bacterium]|nr:hypothetical protein [Candidatus Obscuribacterales bacterium]
MRKIFALLSIACLCFVSTGCRSGCPCSGSNTGFGIGGGVGVQLGDVGVNVGAGAGVNITDLPPAQPRQQVQPNAPLVPVR